MNGPKAANGERIMLIRIAKLLLVALSFAAAPSFAQDYPNKPILLVVPFAPGGSSDFLSRLVGQKLTERLKNLKSPL